MKWTEISKRLAAAHAVTQMGLVAAILAIGGCSNGGETASEGVPAVAVDTLAVSAARITGDIQETMDSGGYTYVRVQTEDGDVWAAGPGTAVTVGATVSISTSMLMTEFHSETLDRTFDRIYFVTNFDDGTMKGRANRDMADAIKRMHGGKDVMGGEEPDISGSVETGQDSRTVVSRQVSGELERAPGGQTVAEIYARRAELAGNVVKVRGVVVKVTLGIMGTNWLHVQDGSCDGESCDLTVTTNEISEVGDVVMIRGILAVDKDFGAGYRYEAIVQDAKLVAE